MKYNEYLDQRAALIDELQTLVDSGASDEDYTAKKAEVDDLDARWDATAQRMADLRALSDDQRVMDIQTAAVKVDNGTVTAKMTFAPEIEDAKSDSYTNAWAKTLMGLELTADERATMQKVNSALTTVSTGVVIPETVAQGIWDGIAKEYPLWADVTKTYVKGNYTVPLSTASSDAAWYDEATNTADGSETLGALNLVGCELARAITVSWKLREMAIADFIPFIQRKLIEKMGAGLGYGVAQGKGKPGVSDTFKPEPMGIVTALKAESQTPQVVEYTAGALTYANLVTARSKVEATQGIAIYASGATIWGELANLVDLDGRPIMIADPTAAGVMRIFGMPVKADASIPAGDILISAAGAGYIANVNKDISIQTEEHVKPRTVDYCAYAIVDGGVTSTKCHALLEGQASGATGATGN
ncbi:MAG: phage major capsid protein [Ruminococcus sp.]|nr:phage major capsid protein [Ruminococcus sp.]